MKNNDELLKDHKCSKWNWGQKN